MEEEATNLQSCCSQREASTDEEQRQQLSERPSKGSGDERQLKRVRLTRKNLTTFDKMAKKKGTIQASASTIPGSLGEPSSTTKTISTTSSGPPANLEDLRTRYAQPRGAASPTESAYEDYVYQVILAENESTMVFQTGRVFLKHYDSRDYKTTLNQAFTGFPKDVGFNDGLSAPQPDLAQGVTKHAYGGFPVGRHIMGSVLSKDTPSSVTLSHIAGEWKCPGKDLAEARLRSAYDGAALVYARNQALSYLGLSDPQGHAEVTTFTTDGTTLNLFAHYAAPSEDGKLEYHQYPIKSTLLTDSHQGLKEGRRGLRNMQDHAKGKLLRHERPGQGALKATSYCPPTWSRMKTFLSMLQALVKTGAWMKPGTC